MNFINKIKKVLNTLNKLEYFLFLVKNFFRKTIWIKSTVSIAYRFVMLGPVKNQTRLYFVGCTQQPKYPVLPYVRTLIVINAYVTYQPTVIIKEKMDVGTERRYLLLYTLYRI